MADRAHYAYASCYCEENVWHLAGDPRLPAGERFVVFMSNRDRTCAVWAQRSAASMGAPVFWDYHVVLVLRAGATATVWDLDTTLPFPCAFDAYLAGTFPRAGQLPDRYEPRFRVIPAAVFRSTFASDRSHMRDGQGVYRDPPPPWPVIGTAKDAMNLERFIDVETSFVGDCVDLAGLRGLFSGPHTR